MNPVAAIFDSLVLYRYSLVLSLAAAAGICFFFACCSVSGISSRRSAVAAFLGVLLSLLLARLVYWYGRPNRFASAFLALTARDPEAFALLGVPAACILAALLTGKKGSRKKMLDCMSLSGCAAISLGRLACFFTESDRGQIMLSFVNLPWAYPAANSAGIPEFRFAVFIFQAAAAAAVGLLLVLVFLRRKHQPGDLSLLFLLCYCASQFLLDSTRYDSLYLRSNGFISLVQVLCALAVIFVLAAFSLRSVKKLGFRRWMVPLWLSLAALLGGAGYMEYYVQRHGREALFAYSIMGICLTGIVALGLLLWHLSKQSIHKECRGAH